VIQVINARNRNPTRWFYLIQSIGSKMRLSGEKAKRAYWFIMIMLFALVLGLIFSSTDLGRGIDGLVFDRIAPLLGTPREVHDPLVILIGEDDYSAAGTPLALWGTHLVPLLERIELGRPEAVGLDMILPQFPLNRIIKNHDKEVFNTLKRISKHCRLISGYGIARNGQIKEPFVLYQKILGPDGYGYLNIIPDPDGVCRKQALTFLADKGDKRLYSFSLLLAGTKGLPPVEAIPDWRNPARIPTLTFQQALKADPSSFTDRVVIIGVDFDFEDRHPTPASMKDEPGVVFQARVVEALRSGRLLSAPPWPYSLLAPAFLMVFLTLFLTLKASLLRVIVSGAGILTGLTALMIGCLSGGIVLRPSAAMVGVVAVCSARIFQGYLIVKDTFGRYVSREVRDEILSGRIPFDGEIKEVTVLFADLRNFTPMVEATPPKQVVNILNSYFREMAAVIREQKGLVLQYIGDEIEAVFGAPVPVPDHSRLAVRAAISMRRRLKMVNRRLVQQGYAPLRHGIGIHTGEVLAANIGGGDRLSYSLVGDTVNLASRLQSLNKQFGTEIIISAQTLTGMDKDIPVKQLPSTPIKGKTKKVDIFAVL
jgi:class 3 adenylate cyclase/CHASE2 domain-containing sensor protein